MKIITDMGKEIKDHYKSKGSIYIKKQIENDSGREQASKVFSQANLLCEEFLSRPDIPKGAEKTHVKGIAARTALYKVLKEQYPDKAWEWIDEQARIDSQGMRSFIKLSRYFYFTKTTARIAPCRPIATPCYILL